MLAKNFKKSLLAVNIGLVMSAGFTGAVFAAEETQIKEDVEVIEVRGIRASTKADINNKRFANAVVDSITAEDIGKFPDKNVAESLSRITGVGVSREFGEGEKITVRGSDPTKNRTLLNGQNVGTADWFILDNPSRSFNFTMLPSSLVSNLEVYKSPEARLDEGSIGGTVILHTRKPLDLDSGTTHINLQSQYSETSEEHDPLIEGLFSWKNEDEKFGILVSGSKSERTVRREGFEVLGWDAQDDGTYTPRTMGVPVFRQDRERTTLFTAIQFAPSDDFSATLNILDSNMDVNNTNSNYLLMNPASNATLSYEGENAVYGSGGTDVRWNHINRISSTDTSSIHLDIDFATDSFSMNVELGTTEAEGGTLNETSWEYGGQGDYNFDLTGSTPTVNAGVDGTDPSKFNGGWIWGGNKPTTDEESYGQVDFDIPVDMGAFTAIKVGVKYRDQKRTQDREAYSWHWGYANDGVSANYMSQIIGTDCPTLAQCDLAIGSDSVGADVVNGDITQQLTHNSAKMFELGLGPDASYAAHKVLGEIFAVEEKKTSYYIQGDFSGDDFRGNIGVRVAKTDQDSSGYLFSSDSAGLLTVDNPGLNPDLVPSTLEWVTESRSYTEILPNFNLSYDLAEDQIVRLSAARTMARPNFFDISPITAPGDLGEDNPTAQAGNPNLDPQLANQFDAAWEFYFDEASLFAITLFYKDIESYQTSGTYMQDFYDQEEDMWISATVTRPENGPGGTTTGLEATLQYDLGGGFGVSANYTYTDAKNDGERDVMNPGSGLVMGASENMLNASAFYEDDLFSVRAMYNYRTEWYKGLHSSGAELWNDDYGQLDFTTTVNVTENISVVFEGINLTNEKVVEYNTSKDRVLSIYENGRRFVLGANFRF
ncbi:TonB-dependent receptor [Pseudoalteromonas haloplanktis]|uniref:TonB-dependent receptor n=1 Tax=Pseudoalteromonas haloplanktis TaxID=228 RepID=A0ABU1BB02_PSEHA|nr:TonB-dependent receptor [Pseudoalteromonas haloplanktis]MDQ9091520.1 TonB-dependent receptor [Pseudoalteromonas haloplanktis]